MLKQKARAKQAFRQTNSIASIPAPVGGLNSRDSLAAMPETDAVKLVNWIPDNSGLRCRKGYREWAINFPSNNPVEGIMGYFAAATAFPGGAFLTEPTAMPGKLFAATKAAIYDITSQTNAPTSAIALSGNTNAGWFSHTMLSNTAGNYLLACSEADGYFVYDGTTWDKKDTVEVTGVDPSKFVHVTTFKRRAWFVERDSASAWYLAADAIQGAATRFDFGPQLKHGGHVSYMANWTIDAGEGVDDLLVVVGSNGDVLVYKGTDPASASTFAIVGSWFVGQIPIGRRAYSQLGGDLLIVSADGVFPISYITRGGAAFLQASSKEYSSKIRPTIGADLRSSFTERGWQVMLHPSERLLLINEPNFGTVANRQYAMSTATNAWTTFEDIPIYSLGSTAGYTFAGTRTGKVLILFSGPTDNVAYGTSTGVGIRGTIHPAFSSFKSPSLEKIFLMARPTMIGVEQPSVSIGMSVNYSLGNPTGTIPAIPLNTSKWDTATWDTAIWGGETRTFANWAGVGGVGFAAAATISTTALADTILTSIDYMYESGGPV